MMMMSNQTNGNHAGLIVWSESEGHRGKLGEGSKWHSCFKYCQDVIEQSA